ncbi:MAG: Mur ligase family protein, partial [Pseudomonadota bacterium]
MEGVKRLLPDQFDPDPALQAALDRLTTYYPKAIDLGLERTFRLLEDLGNPHLHMPPIFHVGGTNGKGSTLAYIRSIAESAGLSCHAMTSPHLVRVNERFVVAGRELENQQLLQLIEEVEDINAGRPTTSFEIMTAAGFLAFTRTPADLTLLEVGMGGRFDATNVIKETLATIITVISRDHTKFLGTELSAIALEKAGIIKENCPVIIGPQTAEGLRNGVMHVFEDAAAQKNAPLYRHGHEWSFDILSDGFMLHTPTNMYHLPPPNLLGTHQYGNAATASMALLTALPALKKPIPLAAFETGLKHAHWLGRLQKLHQGPLVDTLTPTWDIWIDGGHNDTGGQV